MKSPPRVVTKKKWLSEATFSFFVQEQSYCIIHLTKLAMVCLLTLCCQIGLKLHAKKQKYT